MTNKLKFIFIILAIYSCEPKSINNAEKKDSCLPEIIIETNKDTLGLGEQYVAEISLSDDSYYYILENGVKKSTNPIFRINGQLVESHDHAYTFRETVKLEMADTLQSGTVIRNWSVGIIFPHPKGGDVEVSYRAGYVIDNGSPSSSEASLINSY